MPSGGREKRGHCRSHSGDPASGSLSPRTALETEANWDRSSKPELTESFRISTEMSVGCFVFNWEPGFLFYYLKKFNKMKISMTAGQSWILGG